MAIAIASSSFVEQETDASTITATEPSGTVQDNLLVATLMSDSSASPNTLVSNTGWTEIVNGAGSGHNEDLMVEHLTRGASAPDLIWNHANSQESIAVLLRITGFLVADPIGASSITFGSSTTPVCPTITTEVDNSLVLRVYCQDGGSLITEDTGYPASHTGVKRLDTGGGTGCNGGVAWVIQATAGLTGTATWGATSSSNKWHAATIEIKPALGATLFAAGFFGAA